MWQLTPEQTAALAALKRERDLARLGAALGMAFPAVRERVGARLADLVELGAQRGAAQRLTHLLALARYLACWFVLGAEFETKPGHEWAQQILVADDRDEGARVFQLCRRTSEELTRLAGTATPAAAVMRGADFDAALSMLDASLLRAGTLGSLLAPEQLRLGVACDLDAVELRPADGAAPMLYRLAGGQWTRAVAEAARAPVAVSAESGAAAWSPALHLVAPTHGQPPTRLRLRTLAGACCDPTVHPLVALAGSQGLLEWRGPQALDATLHFNAAAPETPPGRALLPAMGLESAALQSRLELKACGLRTSGSPLAPLSTQVQVYPAEQHLLLWQRDAMPAMSWPDAAAATAGRPRVRVERDGQLLDASRWQAGLEALDQQLLAALGRLATAWERESGVTQSRLDAEPRLLAGSAALTWGWAEGPRGLTDAPTWRVAGKLDLIACRLDLRFSGALALQGSRCRLQLHGAAAEELRGEFERRASDADLLTALAPAQASFRQPFVLRLEALASEELTTVEMAAPATGALVGACGLRPHPDGAGLQWFCTLELEPVGVHLLLREPLLGEQHLQRPLLPAMKLVDWSLG
jgi:hypothetical protein